MADAKPPEDDPIPISPPPERDPNRPLISQADEPPKLMDVDSIHNAWLLEMPKFFGLKTKSNFSLIDENALKELYEREKTSPAVRKAIAADLAILHEVMGTAYAEHDRDAKRAQNRYRRGQIIFIVMAFVSTILGSLQAFLLGAVDRTGNALTIIAVIEVVIALGAVYYANLVTADAPAPKWIQERKLGERLRQEYFRFLMYQDPYEETLKFEERANLLKKQVSNILGDTQRP